MTKTFSNPEYGYCPFCGAHGKTRERRPGGNDTCHNGHLYPSSKAMTDVEAGLCDDPEKLKKRISSLEAKLDRLSHNMEQYGYPKCANEVDIASALLARAADTFAEEIMQAPQPKGDNDGKV